MPGTVPLRSARRVQREVIAKLTYFKSLLHHLVGMHVRAHSARREMLGQRQVDYAPFRSQCGAKSPSPQAAHGRDPHTNSLRAVAQLTPYN